MIVTFANVRSLKLTSEAASWRNWSWVTSEKQTGEVFKIDADPGALENGNTLCGSDAATYAVFFEEEGRTLNMAVFRSAAPPDDNTSPDHCGGFSYDINDTSVTETKAALEPDSDSGKWRLNTSRNPIDDSKTVTISLEAKSGVSNYGKPIVFIGRCKSNVTEAYVDWGDYLGDDSRDGSDWKHVTVRVGKATARSERWGVSTDHKATFAPDWAGRLLKDIIDKDTMVLQTTPYGESPTTAIFDVRGLRGVLGTLAGTCGWNF